jgi:nickel transport protein
MKSLLRWGATLGLVGSALLGSWFYPNLRSLALPEKQVIQTLQQVPVFTIANQQGAPLVASRDNQKQAAGVFISRQDAQTFLKRLKKEKPELAKQVRVVPVSLGEVYKLDKANESKKGAPDFTYVPEQEQVKSAVSLLRQQGQQVKQFQGVPLFVAKGGQEQGYLTLQQGEQKIVPFYFEKEQIQQMIKRFKQQKPDLASNVQIKVVPLRGVLQKLQTSNNKQLRQIRLVPSQEALEYIRSQSNSGGGNQAQPQQQ